MEALEELFQKCTPYFDGCVAQWLDVGRSGLASIIDNLSLHPIVRLNLSDNGLEDTTIFHGRFSKLQTLNLTNNTDLTGLADLAAEYPNVTILVDDEQAHELPVQAVAIAATDGAEDGLADLVGATISILM